MPARATVMIKPTSNPINNEPNAARGAATINIKHERGYLTVRHTNQDGETLLQVPIFGDEWGQLWNCLESLGDTTKSYRAS